MVDRRDSALKYVILRARRVMLGRPQHDCQFGFFAFEDTEQVSQVFFLLLKPRALFQKFSRVESYAGNDVLLRQVWPT
jgi:hypothetical protein